MENDIIEKTKLFIREIICDSHFVVLNFQAGYDKQGIFDVIQVTNKMLQLMNVTKDNNLFDIDYIQLDKILLNISKAIEVKNFVLLNDMLEYELEPMLYDLILK
jgi:hypothetical protein